MAFSNPGLPAKPQARDRSARWRRTILSFGTGPLTKWDLALAAVENGLAACNILQKVASPQMANLDGMTLAIDGVELCRRLRRHEGQRPISNGAAAFPNLLSLRPSIC
jgi:CheY-like chemotaxis protein